jgi:hypothetical protein
MISGALANDHYRAARSVPLVRRTAGSGALPTPEDHRLVDCWAPKPAIPIEPT